MTHTRSCMPTANLTCVQTVERLLDEDTQGIYTRERTVGIKGSLVVSVESVSSPVIKKEATRELTPGNVHTNAQHVVELLPRNIRWSLTRESTQERNLINVESASSGSNTFQAEGTINVKEII